MLDVRSWSDLTWVVLLVETCLAEGVTLVASIGSASLAFLVANSAELSISVYSRHRVVTVLNETLTSAPFQLGHTPTSKVTEVIGFYLARRNRDF